MPIISGGEQKTLAQVRPGLDAAAPRRRGRVAGLRATDPAAAPKPERIGVVFVHGIGSQKPGATLLEWSRPVIKILTEWRQRHNMAPDPVVSSRIDFAGSDPAVIELEVPRVPPADGDPIDYPAQTWFVTEAWWASSVQPPSLGTMGRWLVEDMGRVVSAVQHASNARRDSDQPGTAGLSWWVLFVDELQSFAVATIVGILWTIGGALGLPYSIVRSLPLVGEKIAIAQLDTFLIDWFGDLRVLLHDQAQAANIRSRLGETLKAMRDDYGCTSIVLVAHSGGVIVSLTTLNDPLYGSAEGAGAYPVTKLLTIGQGMSLAWRLWNFWKVKPAPGDRLLAPPYNQYPKLRWVDFWGTYDPAPAGDLKAPTQKEPCPEDPPKSAVPPAQAPTTTVTQAVAKPAVSLDARQSEHPFAPDESRPVWNRMSFREDHGGYWDNEEQFVIDLIKEIDTAADPSPTPARQSRFFRGPEDQEERIHRRIERVAILGWWRWLAALAALFTLGWAWTHGAGGTGNRLSDIGKFAAEEFAKLPGHEVGSGPLDAVASIAAQVGAVPTLGPLVALVGQAVLILGVLMFLVTIPGWYTSWDRIVRFFDPKRRFECWLVARKWPTWLPPRVAVAAALYAVGAAVIWVGSRSSIDWVVSIRTWLADRVHSVWNAGSGNVLFGAIVVILIFVVIEVVGASRWEGWDQRERYEARFRPLKPVDRRRVKLQALVLLLLLAAAVILISFVNLQ